MTSIESETNFLSWIMDLARLRGWMIHHCRPAQNQRGKWATAILGDAGFPDLVLARQGRVIFAEVKREGAKPSDDQKRWLKELMPVPSELSVTATIGNASYRFRTAIDRFFSEVYTWRPSDRDDIAKVLE